MAFSSRHRCIRFLSLLLSLLLVVQTAGCTPQSAPNRPQSRGGQTQQRAGTLAQSQAALKPAVGELPDKPPKDKLELTSKRTRYSTRFLNPNGSFTEEISLEPRFYQDPTDKKWKAIDNTLKQKGDRYENQANDLKVRFTPSITDEFLTVEKDRYLLIITPRGATKAKGNSRNNKIRYDNAFPDASLEYQVSGTSVKEDLILNKRPSSSSFRFNLRLKDVTAKERPDGGLVWTMPKPFMVDKAGKRSEKVRLALVT